MADLERYRALLAEWNERLNLVGPSALESFWGRHAYDSAQLLALAPDAKTWADLGAGAGFPGLVLAILLKGVGGAQVHLVESTEKRCRFLQAVVDDLALPAQVHNGRAENLSVPVDIVTARALAPMTRLLGYAKPWLAAGAKGMFLKGGNVDEELREAHEAWDFAAETVPSLSDPSGRIVLIGRTPKLHKVFKPRPDHRGRERHVRR
ncbi:MAG: 16S rRNA (guanine(527)-N(7))-methyltransferase RsmG [Caulobacteraceae bacterium]